MEYLVNTPQSKIFIIRNWLPLADSLSIYNNLKAFLQELDQKQSGTYTVNMRGHKHTLPRKIFIVGDPTVKHKFGGINFPVYEWPEIIIPIRDRIFIESGEKFNSCTVNWYPDGNNFIKNHHDSGVKSRNNAILTVSFGVSRQFDIKGPISISTKVNSGDVFAMLGDANKIWTHGIPREHIEPIDNDSGRISLTFRDL